jgi:hypothetical protein
MAAQAVVGKQLRTTLQGLLVMQVDIGLIQMNTSL